MTEKPPADDPAPDSEFERLGDAPPRGLIREFWDFLRYSKKWWLTPILLALLLIGVLVVLSGSGMAPLIYAFW